MNKSSPSQQYVIPPPDVPLFLYKTSTQALRELIYWAKMEHTRELRISAQRGYMKTVKYLTEEYSPIRILAEVSGFRKICASIIADSRAWNGLTARERRFFRDAYSMRDMLFS